MDTILEQRSSPIPIEHGFAKDVIGQRSPDPSSPSPSLQPPTPPSFQRSNSRPNTVSRIGNYFIFDENQGDGFYKAVDIYTQTEFLCKVVDIGRYQEIFAASFVVGPHDNIRQIVEIVLGDAYAYVFFEPTNHGDLHSYVRDQKHLKENEAKRLFHQIAMVVANCHSSGVILRDLKLRKFHFQDHHRSVLKLGSLEDSLVLGEQQADLVSDKHGCPAYVSPEILRCQGSYSGRCADVWSLGVMLYTMLVGRYPFNDGDPVTLFAKIRRGVFALPDHLSSKAKCLVHSLLRRDPRERLTAQEILDHPWFSTGSCSAGGAAEEQGRRAAADLQGDQLLDQMVPTSSHHHHHHHHRSTAAGGPRAINGLPF